MYEVNEAHYEAACELLKKDRDLSLYLLKKAIQEQFPEEVINNSSLPYVHVTDEYLNYNHLNMFSKLLTKHFYDITTDNLDWCVAHKRFHSLL